MKLTRFLVHLLTTEEFAKKLERVRLLIKNNDTTILDNAIIEFNSKVKVKKEYITNLI